MQVAEFRRYPSLLESSDIDGGSSVAVLTYVRVVLDTLEHPDLIHLILSYLMSIPDKPKPTPPPQSSAMARRRKSLDLLSKVANMDDTPTPDLFNLVDLVLTSLRSRSQQTVSATLRLVSTILRKHHPYSVSTLLKVIPVSDGAQVRRTIGAHNREMELLFSLVGDISEDKDVSESYSEHLKDNLVLLESHPCSAKILALKSSIGRDEDANTRWAKLRDMYTHTIHPSDPLLRNVIELLKMFFSNTVETNLILTAVIVDLATCSWMRPEGWLLFDPDSYEFEGSDESDEEDDMEDIENELAEIMGDNSEKDISTQKERKRIAALKKANRVPRFTSTPPVLEALQDLVGQIRAYRREIPDLDDKLAERKRAFQFTDELNEALLSSPLSSPPVLPLPIRNPKLDSISPRNLARPSSAASSSASRQRQPSGGSTPTVRPSRMPAQIVSTSSSRGISPAAAAAGSPSSPFNSHVTDTTMRRIRVLQPGQAGLHLPPPPEGESREGSVVSDTGTATTVTVGEEGEFTLSHLLTNIMILQVNPND